MTKKKPLAQLCGLSTTLPEQRAYSKGQLLVHLDKRTSRDEI